VTGQAGALGLLLLALLVLWLGVVACDAARGPRSWSEWWDSLR
jgi:hypothetical protein